MTAFLAGVHSYMHMHRWRRARHRHLLEAWQNQRARRLLAFVRARSPFYAEHFAGLDNAHWRQFPTVDKATMMAHFDTFNTRGVRRDAAMALALRAEQSRDFSGTLGDISVGLSSGTSGHRGLFVADRRERAAYLGAVFCKALPAPLWQRHRVALFLRATNNLYTPRRTPWLQLRFFDLITPLPAHVSSLQRFDPTMVLAPPSVLRLLAQAQQRGDLHIRPRRLTAVAEVLDRGDEAFIAAVFGEPVHQYYQCTEGFIGITCHRGTLHLNEDAVVVQREYVDSARRRFVPIVTDLWRTTQPIVRYRLDDVLVLRDEPCPCGSVMTALDRVEGRCDDVFWWRPASGDDSTGGDIPVFPDLVSRAVLHATADVADYRIEQLDRGVLEVALQVSQHATSAAVEEAVRQRLYDLAGRLGCQLPRVVFVPYHPPTPGTKLRRVRSRLPRRGWQ